MVGLPLYNNFYYFNVDPMAEGVADPHSLLLRVEKVGMERKVSELDVSVFSPVSGESGSSTSLLAVKLCGHSGTERATLETLMWGRMFRGCT